MSASPSDRKPEDPFLNFALVRGVPAPSLLLLPGTRGWTLPCIESEAPIDDRIATLNQAVRERVGLEVTVLRRVEERERITVFEMENHSPDRTPSAGRWIRRQEMDGLPLAEPDYRALIEKWFDEAESGVMPDIRPAWARPGWFAEATRWIHDQLAAHGLTALRPVEQFRTWSISCLLKVATRDGDIFLKAAPPIFSHEPVLTRALAANYPGHVPEVLAIEAERSWLLMRGFIGEALRSRSDLDARERAVRLLARMQIDCVERSNWLFSLGCPDRRLDWLTARIEPLFADELALIPASGNGLSTAEIERLRALAPRLRALCEEVATGPVPPTLVHGDFHAGNIVVTGDTILIYDWTDGALAHPFLDLITLLPREPGHLGPGAASHLRDAYLEQWTAFAPMTDLVLLFDQAQILGALYQAVSYQQLTASIEAKSELAGGVPEFLGILLRLTESWACD